MFEILPNPSLETLLIIGRAALLIGAFWIFALAFTRWRRADERDTQRLHAQFERAFAEIRSLHETVSVMSAKLDVLSERAESDSRRAPAGSTAAQRGYDLAMRMARNGSGVDELIASCGITRHEAELLTRLHAAKAPAETSDWQTRSERPATPSWPAPAAQQPQAAAPPAPQPAAGRKRGSLLSVVG
jgi:hypothetical protein